MLAHVLSYHVNKKLKLIVNSVSCKTNAQKFLYKYIYYKKQLETADGAATQSKLI